MANPNVGGTNGMNAAERAAQAKEVSGNNSNANRTGEKSENQKVRVLTFCMENDSEGNVEYSRLTQEISDMSTLERLDNFKKNDFIDLAQNSKPDTEQLIKHSDGGYTKREVREDKATKNRVIVEKKYEKNGDEIRLDKVVVRGRKANSKEGQLCKSNVVGYNIQEHKSIE